MSLLWCAEDDVISIVGKVSPRGVPMCNCVCDRSSMFFTFIFLDTFVNKIRSILLKTFWADCTVNVVLITQIVMYITQTTQTYFDEVRIH